MSTQNKKITTVTLGTTVVCTIITLFVGFFIGLNWESVASQFGPYLGFGNGSSDSIDLSSVNRVYSVLKTYYDGDFSKEDLIEGAKKGLVDAVGDQYTVYMNSEETSDFNASLSGDMKTAGVGISMAKRDGYVRVLRTLPDNPARKAGVLAGDIIYAVDDVEVWDKDADFIAQKLTGEAGTKVKLTVARDNKKIDFNLVREKLNNVSADITYNGKTAIISVYRFAKDTGTLVKKLATEAKNKGITGVVIDLRSNGGGYVDAASTMLGLWIDGETVLVQKSKGITDSTTVAPRGAAILKDTKTVILINNGTASASEIVAGALKDYNKATIVGETSFGKGVVQQMIPIGSDTLKVTTAHWYTPKGTSINKVGIKPDIEVERTYEQINKSIDPQLDKALELLKK